MVGILMALRALFLNPVRQQEKDPALVKKGNLAGGLDWLTLMFKILSKFFLAFAPQMVFLFVAV